MKSRITRDTDYNKTQYILRDPWFQDEIRWLKKRFEEEVRRLNRFQSAVFGNEARQNAETVELDIRAYAKYLLKEGSVTEKRELLGNLKSQLIYKDKQILFRK